MTERVVTRADREAAVEALRECGPSVDAWVPHGRKKKGLVFNTDLLRVAQAIAEAEARGAQASAAEVERLRACLETMATFQDQRAVTARRLGAFNVANACSQFADRIRSGMPVACIVGDGVEQAMVYEDEPNSGEFILYGSPGLLQRAAESERVPTPASAKLARDVATVRFFVDVTIAGGAHPSGAPQALDRITAALGVKP